MEQNAIFAPVFAMILLTMTVWIYMYIRRIAFIQNSNLGPDELAPLEFARISPPRVANPSDNLKNLFEIPVLFYAVATYLFITAQVDTIYLAAAWAFVGLRVLHSAVHCTINIVILRFWIYFTATLIFWFMAGRAAVTHFLA